MSYKYHHVNPAVIYILHFLTIFFKELFLKLSTQVFVVHKLNFGGWGSNVRWDRFLGCINSVCQYAF